MHVVRCGIVLAAMIFTPMSWAAGSAGGIADAPLVPPSAARGKTLFVQLTPESTGIRTENRYDDPG